MRSEPQRAQDWYEFECVYTVATPTTSTQTEPHPADLLFQRDVAMVADGLLVELEKREHEPEPARIVELQTQLTMEQGLRQGQEADLLKQMGGKIK
ncbi:hypothetical protein B9Z55_023177 [Caenorhabditis nigoni]|uniref:Uncharacterized protein n=1 Tax=Caenorhabditis nigoni TaxID=1611254 RepID=A0A2G5SNC9_9PELO|nr:hypothetical protein B9Z55_023177 [Caenorhabditis nigoni]